MFRPVIAFLLAATFAAPPALAAETSETGQWGLARAPGSCMLHSVSPHGTVLSVWGFAGQAKIGFFLQNRQWDSLREGQLYDLKVDFVGVRAWPIQATAKRELDSDGPGFFFTVEPGDGPVGAAFIDAFASATGMEISRDGDAVDSLPLAGSRDAMASLARCMAEMWEPGASAAELEKQPVQVPLVPTT